jgi:hypothetical protein
MLLIVFVWPFTFSVTEWFAELTETTDPEKVRFVKPLLLEAPTQAQAVNIIITTRAAIPTTICFKTF